VRRDAGGSRREGSDEKAQGEERSYRNGLVEEADTLHS